MGKGAGVGEVLGGITGDAIVGCSFEGEGGEIGAPAREKGLFEK
jgi:hypothetical protein